MTAIQRLETTGHPGILRVHVRRCPGGACDCDQFQAMVYDARRQRKVRRHFRSLGEADLWRARQLGIRGKGPKLPETDRTAKAYQAIRRAAVLVDSALRECPRDARPALDEAITFLYGAEDRLTFARRNGAA
jgi:hypothetical protein